MSLKAKVEAIIYATEEPVTLNELAILLKDAVLADLHAEEQARLALNEIISEGGVTTDGDDSVGALPTEDESRLPEEPTEPPATSVEGRGAV
jgi:segregation and condensation protein B